MVDISKGNLVTRLCEDIKLPQMIRVRQCFESSCIPPEEIPAMVKSQLARQPIASRIRPGMRIGITAGSRGVANIALIIRSIVEFLKEKGAEPFVFPAMGSHGGATAAGQRQILEG